MQETNYNITLNRETLTLFEGKYAEDNSTALEFRDAHGECFVRLTVYLPHAGLGHGEILVKTWSENDAFTRHLLAMPNTPFFDTLRRVPQAFIEAHVWRFESGPKYEVLR